MAKEILKQTDESVDLDSTEGKRKSHTGYNSSKAGAVAGLEALHDLAELTEHVVYHGSDGGLKEFKGDDDQIFMSDAHY